MLSWVQHLPRLAGIAPAQAAEFAAPPGDNPIRDLLTEAGIPWLRPRADVARRYGVRPHPAYGWNVIEIDGSQSLLNGLLWPLSALAMPQFSPRMPIMEFSGIASIGDDARANLRHVVEQLHPRLGEPAAADASNTLARRWACGSASLRLTVWPPELQRYPATVPAHSREPRLRSGCHVWFKTGFRILPSALEQAWLESFIAIGDIPNASAADGRFSSAPEESEVEFVREPVGDMSRLVGRIGRSADGAALILCRDQLDLVRMNDVIGFEVERATPARGSGGARLYVLCRSDCPGVPTKRLAVASAPGADDLNHFTETVATATGKPFKLGDYFPDE
jgi:hypothetical protein